jgi:anti-sigma regulatory factor (Ser/Thr protein kinase)
MHAAIRRAASRSDRAAPPRPSRRGRPAPAAADPADGAVPGGIALTLAATHDAPAVARRTVTPALQHWDAARRDAALLVISELVTNAVRHGSSSPSDRIRVQVRRNDRGTRIEVTDVGARGGSVAPRDERTPDDPRSGWGLPIVAELSDSWGVAHIGARTRVWCELDGA